MRSLVRVLKIWVRALKIIKKNDELSYDYGFGYDKIKQFPYKMRF